MRGVYNKLINTSQKDLARGISTASDGNNAQAVAYFCNYFKIKGIINNIIFKAIYSFLRFASTGK